MEKTLFIIGMILLAVSLSACSAQGGTALAAVSSPIPTAMSTATARPIPSQTPTLTATSTKSAQPTQSPTPTLECKPGFMPDFANYATWTKVNPKPIEGHETQVNIYVNDLAKDIYLSASGEIFQPCAAIVKTHLNIGSDSKETVTKLTIMVKMSPGYDPEHNDWWWGMYDSKGIDFELRGRVGVCIGCHQPNAAVDYVFSQKVIEELKK